MSAERESKVERQQASEQKPGRVVLFDRDVSVANLMRQAFDWSEALTADVACDVDDVIFALASQSDVVAVVIDVSSLSASEISALCMRLHDVGCDNVRVILVYAPFQPARAEGNIVRLVKPFDNQMLLRAVEGRPA